MKAVAATAGAIARNDLARELRRPLSLAGVLLFSAASLVALHLAVAGGGETSPRIAAGALWVVLVYAALLGVGRALAVEREEGTWDALLLAPADRTAIFAGKVASSAVLTMVLHAVVVPLYMALFAAPASLDATLVLLAALLLADGGFALVGVLVGAISLRASGRELLASAMFVPLSLPLVIAAVTVSLAAFGSGNASVSQLLGFLLLYDCVFAALGIALFAEVAVE